MNGYTAGIAIGLAGVLVVASGEVACAELKLEVEQLTVGPKHHFFGYIGHAGTVPWNKSGRFVVALRTDFQDRMPNAGDQAEVVLIDVAHDHRVTPVDKTAAWNFQQGTMLFWNPESPEDQFFFNDRDIATNRVFTVLYDLKTRSRLKEYRFLDAPAGNSGVAQRGGAFLAINYGRLARLRPVTGYPGAFDWSRGAAAPADDGIFKVDVATGKRTLLVSFATLRERVRDAFPDMFRDLNRKELFINHTLWNREDSRIYFYCRADFERGARLNIPFTICPDGSGLEVQQFIGGHLEWDEGDVVISADGSRYDPRSKTTVGRVEHFPKGDGDIALSPNGHRLVKGWAKDGKNAYFFLDRVTGETAEADGFGKGPWVKELRVDGAPSWNRDSTAVLFAAISNDEQKTRQLFLVRIKSAGPSTR